MAWKGGLYDALPPLDSREGESGAAEPAEGEAKTEVPPDVKVSASSGAAASGPSGTGRIDAASVGVKPSGWGVAAFAPSSLRPRQTTFARKGIGAPTPKMGGLEMKVVSSAAAPSRRIAVQPVPVTRVAQPPAHAQQPSQILGEIMSGAADEYDPYYPNEYAVIVRRLEKEKYARRLAPKASDVSSTRGLEEPVANKPNVAQKNLSGEEVFLRRARLSGVPDAAQSGSIDAPPVKPRGGEDVARRMLMNMGWREGQGLGRNGQGPRSSEETVRTSSAGSGLPGRAAKLTDAPSEERRSSVVLLRNMVGPGEADADLRSETAEECAKYGAVRRCEVFELPDAVSEESVRIFVDFVDPAAAERAVRDLNGRFFGGRIVKAGLYSQGQFAANQLDA